MIAAARDDVPPGAPPLAGTWPVLYEDLVAGIIHSMNNCVTVLGVSLELSAQDDLPSEAAVLQRELKQLIGLIGLTSALSSRTTRHEALELRSVLDLALTIHALNPATRSVACTVHVTGVLPPVRVSRSVLLRALLLLIDGAKRTRGSDGEGVAIEVTGDAESVVVRVPSGPTLSTDALALATSCGGTLVAQAGWALFALPSLASVRRAGRTEELLRHGAMPTRATGS